MTVTTFFKRINPAIRDRVLSVISPLMLLAIWDLSARANLIDTRFFPGPSDIFDVAWHMMASGELFKHMFVSTMRVLAGFFVGGIPALILGLFMGGNRAIRASIEPIVAAIYPIPKSALVPLMLLIFGLGDASKVAIVALAVFFPILMNTVAGVLEISRVHLDVGRNFKANQWQSWRYIALPGALPMIMTGVRLGLGMGLVVIAVAEMIGARNGLGYMIWNAWELLDVERMYVGLIAIALLGVLFSIVLNEIERLLLPWKVTR